MRNLALSLCLLLSIFAEGQAQLNFDCRRPTVGTVAACSGTGVCQSNGTCACDAPFDGVGDFDCNLNITAPATLTVGTDCVNDCLNGGYCYQSAGVEECSCTPEFTGPTCGIRRSTLTLCRAGDMVVEIYPQAPSSSFAGTIAVQIVNTTTTLTNSGCRYSTTDRFDWNGQRFSLTFSTTQDAGNPCLTAMQQYNTTTDPATNDLRFCYELRLMYSPIGIISVTDETFTFCCTEEVNPDPNGVTVGTDGGSPDGGDNVDGTVDIIKSTLSLTSNVAANNPMIVTDSVSVGTELTLVVEFADPVGRYQDIKVVDCEATATGIAPIPLLLNGCPPAGVLSILRGVRKRVIPPSAKNSVLVDIWAFRPSAAQSDVTVSCTVEVCTTACTAAIPATCPGTSITNHGRRKRAAGNGTASVEIFKTTAKFSIIEIRTYQEPRMGPAETCETCEECGMTKEVFLPVAVVFGLVLLAVLVLAIFLFVRYQKGHNSKGSA